MAQDDNRIPTTRSRKPVKLTRGWLISLGVLTGVASVFWSYIMVLGGGFSIIFPDQYLLAIVAIGAIFGLCITLVAGKSSKEGWTALAIIGVIGFLIPVCFLQIMFLIFRPD